MLLREAGIEFEIIPADIDEVERPDESPREMVMRLAGEKAEAVAARLPDSPVRLVLGSDTIVVEGNRVLGKPTDEEDAVALLSSLVGRRHQVWTGIAVAVTGATSVWMEAVSSEVEMRPADESEIRAYVATGEPMDKAGAYALQGDGRRFVTGVHGSQTNVIGLPVEETLDLLARRGADAGIDR